jgi:large subunit ribosomal protein L6
MSRIGKHPIVIPAGVTVEVKDGIITVKGKNGQLTQEFSDVTVMLDVQVDRSSDQRPKSKTWFIQILINNMIIGVTEGFTKSLELVELVIELQIKDKIRFSS